MTYPILCRLLVPALSVFRSVLVGPVVLGTIALGSGVLAPASVSASDESLDAVITNHWDWVLEQYPEYRREYGDMSGNRSWTDLSAEAIAARHEATQAFIADLNDIDSGALSDIGQLNQRMLKTALEEEVESFNSGLHLIALNMRSGPQHRYTMVERLPMVTESDYTDWLARLEKLPEQLGQYQALLSEGVDRERTQARIIIERIPKQLDALIVDNPEDSPFWGVFDTMSESVDIQAAQAIKARARSVISEQVTPAYAEFKTFVEEQYLPNTREHPGIGTLPGGKAIYAMLARHFTTTDMTPEEIHNLGLAEVARIRGEMQAVIDEVGFEGDISAFNDFLRNDPQFYYETAEELLEAYQAVSKRLDPELVKLFGKLPRMPYGVRPIAPELAPDTTTAYYMRPALDGSRPGWYYVNLYKPEVRPKYEIEVLSVHESVPGHHLQIALAQEIDGLPEFRRNSSVTAFIEGWGLYSERLGYDMGLYQDPYSRYGQLIYDMWRAVRLVVDTGIHYFGWSRQEAIDYFKFNAAKTEADIINEIDRYIGWPGQALAYKIGQLKMLELRANAERTLGERFDIRAFHDELLGAGAIPLDALEARMDRWIAAEKAKL
jgi:prolyl oligopeptidase